MFLRYFAWSSLLLCGFVGMIAMVMGTLLWSELPVRYWSGEASPASAFILDHLGPLLVLWVSLSIAGIVASAAILRRAAWGVLLWKLLLGVCVLWCLLLPTLELSGWNGQSQPRFNAVATIPMGVVCALFLVWLLVKLHRAGAARHAA